MNTLLLIVLLRDVPFWTAGPLRRWLRRLVAVLYVYVGLLAILLMLENRLLYPGANGISDWREPPAEFAIREIWIPIAGGGEVMGWYTQPEGWKPSDGAVLLAHGNGSNISTRGRLIGQWQKHLNRAVLCFDYPGYGRSPDRPSEALCYAAGDGAYDWLVQHEGIPAREIVLVGESLGGGIAVDQAVRREHRMLITLAAFTSFPDMAALKFPWLPGRWLVRNQFNNLRSYAVASVSACARGRKSVTSEE